jgi:ligand-binding sensor domain-containing protein/two-component sensor histidine kinase
MQTHRIGITVMVLLYLSHGYMDGQRSLIGSYTVGDGLVMNRVRGFHQDNEGFIWMYTWDGLSRYEGYRFRNYIAVRDLQHSFVNDILESPDGSLFLPLNDGTMAVMRNQKIGSEILTPGDVINDFCVDEQGRTYAATDNSGIRLFENGTLMPGPAELPVTTIVHMVYAQGHFFFIGPYSGPSGVYDKEMNLIAEWHGTPAYYTNIYKDHMDRIFVCTLEGLKEVYPQFSSFILKDASIIPHHAPWKAWNVNAVLVTPENDAWIGTSQGLIHLRSDQSWSLITVQDGLLSNQVSALFLDRSNTLWIGTDAGAASINLQARIENNRNLPGVYSNFVLPTVDGSVYTLSGNAFLNRVDNHLNIINSAHVIRDGDVPIALIPDLDQMLLVTSASIIKLDTKSFPFEDLKQVSPGFQYAQVANRYWVISDYGFQCGSVSGSTGSVLDLALDVTSIAQARDEQLLIGTLKNGIFLARPGKNPDSCKLTVVQDFLLQTGDLGVRSLMTSANGDIWIGTRFNGVVRLQCNEDYSDCSKQIYSIPDGLVSNWITSFTEDDAGNIWVGSASGIDKLIPGDHRYYVFSFSRVNGYYANIRQLVMHPADGSLWAGHSEGLTRIIDGNIDTIGPSLTYITEAELGGNAYPSFQPSPVTLRYHQNSAHFAFAAPDYINSSQLLFTYRLLGSKDTAWSQPVKTHEIFYGNLTPGKFRFEVAAFGWNGERGQTAGYAFEILNPFWKQGWFILLCCLIAGAVIVGLYRFRIAQIHRVQSVRDRIAADLHDEIGSSLTHINILSEIGKQQYTKGDGAPDLFERIGSEVQASSEALDDIIWSVRARRDAIGDVIARMRQYATEIFEPVGIAFQLHEQIEGIQTLEMEFKRDFYLIYKELLRNILRHAEASEVNAHVHVDRTKITIHIRDNGKGFDISAPTQRSGLSNIKVRAQKWHGTAFWTTRPGMGTEVTVEMRH